MDTTQCRHGHAYIPIAGMRGCYICRPESWRQKQRARGPVQLRSDQALTHYLDAMKARDAARGYPKEKQPLYHKLRKAGFSRADAVAECNR